MLCKDDSVQAVLFHGSEVPTAHISVELGMEL